MRKILLFVIAMFMISSICSAQMAEVTSSRFFSWCKNLNLSGYKILDGSLEDDEAMYSAEFISSTGAMESMTIDLEHISAMDFSSSEPDPEEPEMKMTNTSATGRKAIFIEVKVANLNCLKIELPEIKGVLTINTAPGKPMSEMLELADRLNISALK